MKLFFAFVLCLLCIKTYSQSWVPTNAPTIVGRYDDISFISPDTGWVVGSMSSSGFINCTKDGGVTWTTLKTLSGVYMRSIEFANKNIGFAGALEQGGQNVFFKTTDGGLTWTDISNAVVGPGICGICCVNANVVYAVGVYSTPAYVMKTTNGGATWTKIDMSSYASGLVDVQFVDAITGYAVGQSNVWAEGGVILKTVDGGVTWTKVYKTNVSGEYVWKIQNLNGTNWYASVERAGPGGGMNVFLKSINGGTTWTSQNVATSSYFQGIGFLTTQLGWTGNNDLYRTSNGGTTWVTDIPYSPNNGFNRFQKVSSTIAYFSSNKIYKWGGTTTGVNEPEEKAEEKNWLTVFPNPTKETISYQLNLPNKTMYVARLFNSKNEMIWEEPNQKEKGTYTFNIPVKVDPGIYYVYVMYNEGVECRKVIVE